MLRQCSAPKFTGRLRSFLSGTRNSSLAKDIFVQSAKERKRAKQDSLRVSTMFTITHVTQPTVDTRHPLLLLQSEHGDRFLFGQIPEGTQRTFPENKTRLSKLENIFLTGEMSWNSIGGLPGMILTLSDQGIKCMNLIYGNDIVNYIVSTWRYFVFRFGMRLNTKILKDGDVFENKLMKVRSIVVNSPSQVSSMKSLTSQLNTGLKYIVSKMFPEHEPTARHDPASDPQVNVNLPREYAIPKQSTSYEINFNPIRGRFKVEEAMRLGVPKGQLFAQLTKGLSVTLPNGDVVKSEQVLEKQRSFAKILILDIPSDSYWPQFLEKFQVYEKSSLGAVYYFLGEGVSIGQPLLSLMQQLDGEKTQHFVSHFEICPNGLVFQSSAVTTLKLKAVQNKNYNLPRTDRVFSKDFYECFQKELPQGSSRVQRNERPLSTTIDINKVHVLLQNDGIIVEPYTDGENEIKVRHSKSSKKTKTWAELYEQHVTPLGIPGATYNSTVESQKNVNNFNSEAKKGKIEVVTLGTGSSLPSKYRNVISTLVKIPYNNKGKIENRNILLDAGENTLGAILRLIPSVDIPGFFRDLKLIYLSHLHADHHLGIASILNEWYKQNLTDPSAVLYIVVPWQYNIFVKEWLSLENSEILERLRYVSCEHLVDGGYVRKELKPVPFEDFAAATKPALKKRRLEFDENSSFRDRETITQMYRDLKILRFQTCRAKHCDWAYSNSISFFTGSDSSGIFKVSYSGDTRPNVEKFSKTIGRQSDLLIHEATLDNDLVEDAIKKRHCTINEAIEVSNKMGARKLILTHFSQRYPKLPQIGNSIEIEAQEYCFAFDGMIVGFDEIGEQTPHLRTLNEVFIEEQTSEANEEESV